MQVKKTGEKNVSHKVTNLNEMKAKKTQNTQRESLLENIITFFS